MLMYRPPFPSFALQGLMSLESASSGSLNDLSVAEPPEHWQILLQLLPSSSALYILYERALLGQPIIILGQNPQHTSALVHAIVDLIRPVPYSGIVRPYLPMQSIGSDMSLFDPASHIADSPISMIVGITNPFLLQRVARSPNPPYILSLNSQVSTHSPVGSPPASHLNSIPRHPSIHKRAAHRVSSVVSAASGLSSGASTLSRVEIPGSTMPAQPRPSRLLKSDRKWNSSDLSAGSDGSAILRMHFAHLTARVLAPINRSLATNSLSNGKDGNIGDEMTKSESPLIIFPSRSKKKHSTGGSAAVPGVPSMETMTAETFPVETFVAHLPKDDSIAFTGQTGRGRQKAREEFYTAFCNSLNFAAWLDDVASWVGKKAEAGVLG
jgi:hypothetical protein